MKLHVNIDVVDCFWAAYICQRDLDYAQFLDRHGVVSISTRSKSGYDVDFFGEDCGLAFLMRFS